mgnify:CR=1 FL=1
MCIRDRAGIEALDTCAGAAISFPARALDTVYQNTSGVTIICLLYTSDAADDPLCVDLGGRRIIKKKRALILYYCNVDRYIIFYYKYSCPD